MLITNRKTHLDLWAIFGIIDFCRTGEANPKGSSYGNYYEQIEHVETHIYKTSGLSISKRLPSIQKLKAKKSNPEGLQNEETTFVTR